MTKKEWPRRTRHKLASFARYDSFVRDKNLTP